MAHISDHAVLRYQERVENLAPKAVRAKIGQAAPTIDKAAEFGCGTVIMGNGARLRLRGDVVATVLGKRVR